MGAVEERLTIETEEAKGFLRVDHADDDTLIDDLIAASKQAADDYLNNPFCVLERLITVSGVQVGDAVSIAGVLFTAAAVTDLSDHEFAVKASDAETAQELLLCINDPTDGLREAKASRTGAVLTLSWRVRHLDPVEASSAAGRSLDCQVKLTEQAIPEAVKAWVLARVARLYERRTEGMARESLTGLGGTDWGGEDYSLLAPYRVFPGL